MKTKILLIYIITSVVALSGCVDKKTAYDRSKVFKQEYLLKDARRIAESGDYLEALNMCDQAMGADYINQPTDKHGALALQMYIYRIMGDYGQSLKTFEEFIALSENPPLKSPFKEELGALIHYKETNDPGRVYEYIRATQESWANVMPPKGFSFGSVTRIADILRLYDTIGDLDAGIAYIDTTLNWTSETDKDFKDIQMNITADEASSRTAYNLENGAPNPHWRQYQWLREFLVVREAFEQDKREGTKGRATKAIIQSDYFPW